MILSKFQFGFTKVLNVAQYLLPMTEKWKDSIDQGGTFGGDFSTTSKVSKEGPGKPPYLNTFQTVLKGFRFFAT